jgi:O-methyltransferase
MTSILISPIRQMLRRAGFDVVRYRNPKLGARTPPDFDEASIRIFRTVEPFTMTGPERIYALLRAVDYIAENKIPGDFVECGVWRGGSTMAMALQLLSHGVSDRVLHLYDTYTGMNAPTDADDSLQGQPAADEFQRTQTSSDTSTWCYSPIEDVKKNVLSTGYPERNVHFIKGKVEDSIPSHIPEKIALLRLDTDWYESTKHEMTHLFPRLVQGGVLIIDDYGHWEGARRAVDEYLADNGIHILLNRVDYTARIGVKA